jgi:hypothetical protein
MTDIVALLREDHVRMVTLAAQVRQDGTDTQARRAALMALRMAMTAYARAEEAAVYEALKTLKQPQAEALAHQGYAEHGLLEHLADKLARSTAVTSPSWTAHATVLHDLLAHHIGQKAPIVAALLEQLFTPARRAEMAQAYQSIRADVTAPQPLRRRA